MFVKTDKLFYMNVMKPHHAFGFDTALFKIIVQFFARMIGLHYFLSWFIPFISIELVVGAFLYLALFLASLLGGYVLSQLDMDIGSVLRARYYFAGKGDESSLKDRFLILTGRKVYHYVPY